MPDGAAGGSPWAADGPAGAWWRGDPAAAAARFAALDRPTVPPVPPASVVTLPPPPLEAAVPPVDAAPTPADAALSPAGAALSPAGAAAEPPAGVDVPGAEHEPDSTAGALDAASDDTPDGAEDGRAQAFAAPVRDLATEPEPAGVTSPPEEAAEDHAPPAADSLPPDDGDSTREDDVTESHDLTPDDGAWAHQVDASDSLTPADDAVTPVENTADSIVRADGSWAHEDDAGGSKGLTPDDGVGEHAPSAAARSESRPSDAAGPSPEEEATDEDAPLAAATAVDGAPDDAASETAAADPAEPGDLTPDLAVPAPAEEAPYTGRLRAAAPDLSPSTPDSPLAVDPEHPALADADFDSLEPETAPTTAGEAEPIDDTQDHRLWRATSRQRLAAEAAEPAWTEEEDAGAYHNQTTVVLPPMPDRALIPTPSPAPADEELPFWLPTQEIPRRDRPGRQRSSRPPKPPRSPAVGLVGLVVLALLATFFAWVSAEPLWLAVGHGDSGTATVSECTGSGVGHRCVGEFSAASGAFTAEGVRLVGVARDQSAIGSTVTARMVGADSGRAYVGDTAAVRHLRWALGLILVVLCGLGLVWVTGARRLEDRWSRRTATLTALTAPLLVTVAFLAATF